MSGGKADIAGLIAGTMLAGGGTIWMLTDSDKIASNDLGVAIAILLVVSGILGLAASGRN